MEVLPQSDLGNIYARLKDLSSLKSKEFHSSMFNDNMVWLSEIVPEMKKEFVNCSEGVNRLPKTPSQSAKRKTRQRAAKNEARIMQANESSPVDFLRPSKRAKIVKKKVLGDASNNIRVALQESAPAVTVSSVSLEKATLSDTVAKRLPTQCRGDDRVIVLTPKADGWTSKPKSPSEMSLVNALDCLVSTASEEEAAERLTKTPNKEEFESERCDVQYYNNDKVEEQNDNHNGVNITESTRPRRACRGDANSSSVPVELEEKKDDGCTTIQTTSLRKKGDAINSMVSHWENKNIGATKLASESLAVNSPAVRQARDAVPVHAVSKRKLMLQLKGIPINKPDESIVISDDNNHENGDHCSTLTATAAATAVYNEGALHFVEASPPRKRSIESVPPTEIAVPSTGKKRRLRNARVVRSDDDVIETALDREIIPKHNDSLATHQEQPTESTDAVDDVAIAVADVNESTSVTTTELETETGINATDSSVWNLSKRSLVSLASKATVKKKKPTRHHNYLSTTNPSTVTANVEVETNDISKSEKIDTSPKLSTLTPAAPACLSNLISESKSFLMQVQQKQMAELEAAKAKPKVKALETALKAREEETRKKELKEAKLRELRDMVAAKKQKDASRKDEHHHNVDSSFRRNKKAEETKDDSLRLAREEKERRVRERQEQLRRQEAEKIAAAEERQRLREIKDEADRQRRKEEEEAKRVQNAKLQAEAEARRRRDDENRQRKIRELKEERMTKENMIQRKKAFDEQTRSLRHALEQKSRLANASHSESADRSTNNSTLLKSTVMNNATVTANQSVEGRAILEKLYGNAASPTSRPTTTAVSPVAGSKKEKTVGSSPIEYKTPMRKGSGLAAMVDSPSNYDISGICSSDSSDDEDDPKRNIPSWAHGVQLKAAIIQQHAGAVDPDNIFPSCEATPDLTEIFPTKDKKKFKRRGSSAVWNYDSPILRKN